MPYYQPGQTEDDFVKKFIDEMYNSGSNAGWTASTPNWGKPYEAKWTEDAKRSFAQSQQQAQARSAPPPAPVGPMASAPVPLPPPQTVAPAPAPAPAPAAPAAAPAQASTPAPAPPVAAAATSAPPAAVASTDMLQGSTGTLGKAWMGNTASGGTNRQSLAALKSRVY
jgi:hypothetical protein